MRLFITGMSGLLGLNAALQTKEQREVSGCYYSHPIFVKGVRALRIDATRYDELRDVLEGIRPDVILHTAGLTNVDRCEENPSLAYQLNVSTSENASRIAAALGASLIHISTDHLFDGTQALVKEETPPTPLNVYGRTKWEAEQVVQRYCPGALIIRTNFYGWGTSRRKSLSDWILDGLQTHRSLGMFSDVFFTPIFVNDLIDVSLSLLEAGGTGVFNVAGSERVSKDLFARLLAEVFTYSQNGIRCVSIDEAGLRARRPRDMSLSCEKVTGFLGRKMPGVMDGLKRMKAFYEQGWHKTMDMALQNGLAAEALKGPR